MPINLLFLLRFLKFGISSFILKRHLYQTIYFGLFKVFQFFKQIEDRFRSTFHFKQPLYTPFCTLFFSRFVTFEFICSVSNSIESSFLTSLFLTESCISSFIIALKSAFIILLNFIIYFHCFNMIVVCGVDLPFLLFYVALDIA